MGCSVEPRSSTDSEEGSSRSRSHIRHDRRRNHRHGDRRRNLHDDRRRDHRIRLIAC